MEIVKNTDDISNLKENKFIGTIPQIKNSTINFANGDNVIYCEENVRIENSKINFRGRGGVLYLASAPKSLRPVSI